MGATALKRAEGGTTRQRPAWDLPLRVLTAMVGSYGLAAAVTALLARLLPGSAIDAATAATLMSFAVYAAAIVWVFAARSAPAVTGWIVGLTLLAGTAAWSLLPAGAVP